MNNLNDEIIIKIMNNLEYVKNRYSLSLVNKEYNSLITPEIEKYKLIKYLNNDYLKFYEELNKNEFDFRNKCDLNFMNKVITRSFMNIPTIQSSRICSMYDLRYVFEFMYNGYDLETDDIKIYNSHFYIHFYEKIKKCIIHDNRDKTINNIEKCSYLFSLKQNPNFHSSILSKQDFKWISIQKD
jgi:hypothetical protein